MTHYYDQLTTNAEPAPKDPINLVNQYLYALNALAYGNEDNNEAEACYRQALNAYDYVVRSITDATVLDFYAKTLEDYESLLANKLFKQAEADAVAAKAKAVRDRLRQLTPSTNQPNSETLENDNLAEENRRLVAVLQQTLRHATFSLEGIRSR